MFSPTYSQNFVDCSVDSVSPVLSDTCNNLVAGFQRQEAQTDYYAQASSVQSDTQILMLNSLTFYLFLILIFLIVAMIARFVFRLIHDISLGW